jgi:membrane fusion protein (multidrug efflux system)
MGSIEERLRTTGTVLANERVEIVSEIAGKVAEVLFEEDTWVATGQVLFRLDTSTLEAERDRALHRYELFERQEARQRQLVDDGLLSQEDYDFTVGEMNVQRSELELRRAILARAEIRAPFAGQVGLRLVSIGSFVSSQTPLTSLQDLNPVKLEFSVPESYARAVRNGAGVLFRVQGVEAAHEGVIYAREPGVDPQTRSLTLRARAANPRGELIPGSFAEVEISVREASSAISVPSIAVIPELGGKKVFILEEGQAKARRVETGIRTDTRVEIVSGLVEGDLVIISNVARLAPGVEVVISDPDPVGESLP